MYIVLPIRMLPDGAVTLLCAIDATTSSGVRLKLRSLFGSIFTTTVLTLEPIGGGAERPGIVENNGLMRVAARSLISSSLRPGLLNTSSPTGSDEASNLITCGGNAPGGKKVMARFSCSATWAVASAISVLSKKVSFSKLMPCMFLLEMPFIPFTYRN